MSIFDVIQSDHDHVTRLFEQVENAVDEAKVRLIERCVQELLLHTIAEEETLYRKLRDSDDLRDDILESEVEHALIERLAHEIMSASPDDERCDARMRVLRGLVEHHIDKEEVELLPIAYALIDASTAEALGAEMLARKASLVDEGEANDERALALEDSAAAPGR